MAIPRTLWCIEGHDVAQRNEEHLLGQGLQLHLRHGDLLTMTLQAQGQQQSYVQLPGCPGCYDKRCIGGCYVVLLRRLLAATIGGVTLRAVPRGIVARSYTQLTLAWPTANAQTLSSELLQPWSNARLLLHWKQLRSKQAPVGAVAVLATEGGEANPVAMLATLGWRGYAVPLPPGRTTTLPLTGIAIAQRLPGRPFRDEPTLLFPVSNTISVASEALETI
jgi:hypothetical protein